MPLDRLLDLRPVQVLLFSEFLLKAGLGLSDHLVRLFAELLFGSLKRLDSFQQVLAGVSDVLCSLVGLVQLALEVDGVELVLVFYVGESLL